MSRIVTEAYWIKHFNPMVNHITKDGLSYETYGDELDYVSQQDERFVWTEMDGDNGVYIVSGFHYVNRIQYYVTNVPWTEDTEIVVCEYIDCDCYDGDVDPKNNCPECGGTGTKTVWGD